ncbi:hypothetical protein BDN70DRAFT_917084 [Pholiota conissans]|uniref:Galactose oxidase n=1 Tax=Pholiota conissans TaxID=109636 RepID=A0A9P5ZES6_9AGAR|nr:hypothetical protein BDN70DRAFT_917084 [Pholiota conissans]
MANFGIWSLAFLLIPQQVLLLAFAYDVQPRWGQATVTVADVLFVYGGKVDEFNQFSYSSAPNVNDVLLLPLSASFSASSPPWQLVSSSTNASTSQGPALAWSTLSAFNNTECFLFGGQLGTTSASSSGEAGILDIFSRVSPQWTLNVTTNGTEPPSRMRHTSVTTPNGLVFIFGGERTDGSNMGFSDHFYYDPNAETFTLLPTYNAPLDIFGHASIILSDGRILVFGGFSPSQGNLISFASIWVLDTSQSSFNWTVINTATTAVPSPRVAFAAVLIEDGKILIHGGCDASFQTNINDGWVLDTTQNPMTWTIVDGLSQLGGRRDHFAVHSGGQVIFGFGYGNNGPAPASLQIFDPSSGSCVPTYTPPPITATPTQTLPPSTQTSHANSPSSQPYSSTHGIHPTSTESPGGGGTIPSEDKDDSSSSTTAIAVGSSFGVLSLIVIGLGTAYYIRKRRREHDAAGQFMALDGDDGDGTHSPHFEGDIPAAMMHEADPHPYAPRKLLSSLGIAGALGVASRMRSVRSAANERRDMLADEDAQSFGEWYNSRRRDGTSGSSWSLRSILGGSRLRSREASTTSHGTGGGLPPLWREKNDPFSDGASMLRDEETGFVGAAVPGGFGSSRPRARRDASFASYASSLSGPTCYRDPFVDPIHEEPKEPFKPMDLCNDHAANDEDEDHVPVQPSIRYVPPLTPLRTVMPPPSQEQGHLLSPLSEHTSQSTLQLHSGSSNAHSSDNILSPFTGGGSMSQATSLTSISQASPASPTSIIGAADPMVTSNNKPMRRSDSWWAKFSRTSLLDRRSSDSSKVTRYDIRDPTPAPRLGAIEEASVQSPPTSAKHSPESTEQGKMKAAAQSHPPLSRANSGAVKLYEAGAGHGKSMSSLRTADSEAIERMAAAMDVTQRVKSRSRWGSGSTSSGGGLSIDTHGSESVSEVGDHASLKGNEQELGAEDLLVFTASPVDDAETPRAIQAAGPSRLPSPPPPPPPVEKSTTTKFMPTPIVESGKQGKVSSRIKDYERHMSLGEPISPAPTNTKHREERTKKRVEVDYGLVPRASLFVANPDHRLSNTSDS